MKRMLLALLVALLLVAALNRAPHPIPIGSDAFFYGYITQGEMFGVKIGQTRDNAANALTTRGFEATGPVQCDYWRLKETIACQMGKTFDTYLRTTTFRHGELYVELDGDKVSAIIWSLYFLPYVDF